MEIEFDPDKDQENRRKHRISLAAPARMDLAAASLEPDDRYDYGEVRYRVCAPLDGRLHMLVFTMRGNVLRAISPRKANAREVKGHDQKDRAPG